VAKLFVSAGVITLCSFITPAKRQRQLARDIVGSADFLEVFVKASFAACEARDPKGLYAKAKAGGVKQFTGKDSAFEEPEDQDGAFVIDTEAESPAASLEKLHAYIAPKILLT
jgi:adenylylsulfate kinase